MKEKTDQTVPPYKPTHYQSFLFGTYRFLTARGRGVVLFFVGMFLGRLSNELAGSAKTLPDLWDLMFSVRLKQLNWSTWLFLAGIFIPVPLLWLVTALKKKAWSDVVLGKILQRLKHPSIAKYPFFGVDSALTVVPCPEPERGWTLSGSQVDLTTTAAHFEFSQNLQSSYLAYKRTNYETKKFADDRQLLMLTKNPRVFTDAPMTCSPEISPSEM